MPIVAIEQVQVCVPNGREDEFALLPGGPPSVREYAVTFDTMKSEVFS